MNWREEKEQAQEAAKAKTAGRMKSLLAVITLLFAFIIYASGLMVGRLEVTSELTESLPLASRTDE